MTRINVLPVGTLTRPHLHAEYKELPSVFTMVRRRYERSLLLPDLTITAGAPSEYTLGQGHMLFFADKLEWLAVRYAAICEILTQLGYDLKPRDLRVEFSGLPSELWGWYDPTPAALAINKERIDTRLKGMGRGA